MHMHRYFVQLDQRGGIKSIFCALRSRSSIDPDFDYLFTQPLLTSTGCWDYKISVPHELMQRLQTFLERGSFGMLLF